MPANKKLKPILKSHVGRTFGIRKYSLIPVHSTANINSECSTCHRDDIGEAVLVLDETNVRVRVTLASGGTGWIAKHFLHKELKSTFFKKHDILIDVISNLAQVYSSLDEPKPNVGDMKAKLAKLLGVLRELSDAEQTKALNL